MICKGFGRRNGFEQRYNSVKIQLARVRWILSRLFPSLSRELNTARVIRMYKVLLSDSTQWIRLFVTVVNSFNRDARICYSGVDAAAAIVVADAAAERYSNNVA